MAVNTGLGRYEEGMRLEASGLSGAEIARKLGYKNAQSWYGSKQFYSKRQEQLLARCAPTTASKAEPAPLLESLPDRVPIEGKNGAAKARGQADALSAAPEAPGAWKEPLKDDPKAEKSGQADIMPEALKGATDSAGCTEAGQAMVKVSERRVSLEGVVASYFMTEKHLCVKMRSAGKCTPFMKIDLDDLGGLIAELEELVAYQARGGMNAP